MTMRVGKYRGRSFAEIAQIDRPYCAWVLRSDNLPAPGFRKLSQYLKQVYGGLLEMGKHKGMWFSEVLSKEPDYCIWVMSLKDPGGGFHKLIEWLRKNFDPTQDEEPEPPDKKAKRDECKICFDGLIDSVFVPCGHVLACMTCAVSVDQCPVCKSPCEALKIFRA